MRPRLLRDRRSGRDGCAQCVAEEENDLYPKLMRTATREMNMKMTLDFRREFTRYIA